MASKYTKDDHCTCGVRKERGSHSAGSCSFRTDGSESNSHGIALSNGSVVGALVYFLFSFKDTPRLVDDRVF